METAAIKLSSQSTGMSSSLRLSDLQAGLVKQLMAIPAKGKEELFESCAPIMKHVDNTSLMFYIAYCIGDYLAFIGLESAMTEKQTNETALIMADAHPNLPIDALKLFFNNCKRGIYGKHYNRMDGSVLLQWFDKFCDDFFIEREEADYQKHLELKEGCSTPLVSDGEVIDFDELYAAFHGKTKEEMERDSKIKQIRSNVCRRNMHLYDTMSVEEADKAIEELIIKEMQANNLLTF